MLPVASVAGCTFNEYDFWIIKMRKRLKALFLAAATAGLGIVAYVTTLPLTEQEQYVADMEALAQRRPDLRPMIKHVCPDCTIPKRAIYIGDYMHSNGRTTENICKKREGSWWFYGTDTEGNGVGGDKPCPVNPVDYPRHPINGRHPGWARESRERLQENDKPKLRQFLRRKLEEEKD